MDKEVRKMKKQKGQDLIEYALMLALVVGIGGFIYTQGYGANISGVFNNAGNLLEQVDKSQEEAKEEAARNADRSYADYLGELLKKAVANGTIKLSNGSSVYLLVQNEPNSKYSGTHMNAAKTGDTVKIKDKEYGKEAWFSSILDAAGGDYSNAGVQQDGVFWYGVQIKKDSTGNGYTLSYMDSNKDSYNSNKTGFKLDQANEPYKTESWTP